MKPCRKDPTPRSIVATPWRLRATEWKTIFRFKAAGLSRRHLTIEQYARGHTPREGA